MRLLHAGTAAPADRASRFGARNGCFLALAEPHRGTGTVDDGYPELRSRAGRCGTVEQERAAFLSWQFSSQVELTEP